MANGNEIQYAQNKYKDNGGNDWMEDPIYDDFELSVLKTVHNYHQSIPGYEETPLIDLKQFANDLGVKKVLVKDESKRFNLNAFKVLGASFSLAKELVGKTNLVDKLKSKDEHITWEHVLEAVKKRKEDAHTRELVLATATDGNHGYGVAWIGKQLGVKCFIYMPQGTVNSRIKRIENLGATVNVTSLSYDETVELARSEATKNNWIFIQDTTMENYLEIPLQIMQGYSTIVSEVFLQMTDMKDTLQADSQGNAFSHIFLQAGVGSFAGGIVGALVNYTKSGSSIQSKIPKIVVVEPKGAHCFFYSHNIGDGNLHGMEGDLQTIMAGLNCGTPSEHGWRILKKSADVFLSCDDQVTIVGMKQLYFPSGSDDRIISGESGAVCVGALSEICKREKYDLLKKNLGLDKRSNILIISTEGDTDKEGFDEIIGKH